MQTRRIGDTAVSAIGLGGMPMSIEGRPDEQRSVTTIHAALEAGVTLIDTADAYHLHADEVGHNESLIARALASYGGDTSGVLVATKGGHLRPGDGSWTLDGSPQHLKEACEASLQRRGVAAIGLGGMPMSIEGRPDESRSIAAVHAALDSGVTLIDTADAYHLNADDTGHNESLIAKALATYGGDTSDVLVATKGGHERPGDGSWTLNGSPAYLKQACERSLKRLGVEAIGLYQFHRPDPAVPYSDSVGAIRDLLDEGKIRMAGISNADPAQIREANEILGGRLASVQNQFSPAYRSSETELRLCDVLGIAFLPWSPLGGISGAGELGSSHSAFAQVAQAHGVSPQQVALAWQLAKSPIVIPIPGSSRPETARDSAKAADLELTDAEFAQLDAA
jgi:aryl-alcohol dehydrogenase-like predicted oxidoreductase